MRGFAPFRPEHTTVELHLSHWTGPLADLQVSPNWTYGGRWQGLFGRVTYRGAPVHGFARAARARMHAYVRYLYIDTYNSVYGPAGSAIPPSRHTSATAPSVTASSRSGRRAAIRAAAGAGRRTASDTA